MIYIMILNSLILSIIIAIQWAKLKLWKLEQNLEDWISFGTGNDIVRAKAQRQEYQHYVKLCEDNEMYKLNIPASTIKLIRKDLADNSLFKVIYIKLLWLRLRGYKF